MDWFQSKKKYVILSNLFWLAPPTPKDPTQEPCAPPTSLDVEVFFFQAPKSHGGFGTASRQWWHQHWSGWARAAAAGELWRWDEGCSTRTVGGHPPDSDHAKDVGNQGILGNGGEKIREGMCQAGFKGGWKCCKCKICEQICRRSTLSPASSNK